MPAGSYHLRVVDMARWTAASITLDGRDVLRSALEVSADASNMAITLTEKPAALVGTVQGLAGGVLSGYTVVLFPSERASRERFPLAVFASKVGTDGGYRMQVLPGNYLLAVTDDIEEFAWHDPRVLEALSAGATAVTILPGETKTQDLRVAR